MPSYINENCYEKIPHLILDKKYKRYELLDLLKTNYFLKLPLVYINAKYYYYYQLIDFLHNYNKYNDFKKYDDIFLKHFLKAYEYKTFAYYDEGNFMIQYLL